jgi:hypothetical protein
MFDQKLWRRRWKESVKLTARPRFSIMEFIAIDNERLIPQQSISSVTNIDDVGTHIRLSEHADRRQYLQIIDLPLKERPHVMQELSMMGITAGSLFPGFDGACEELRERNFRS